MSRTITSVRGRRVWDSRGRPTVEAEVACGPHIGRAIAPSGASTGSAEAVERRDGGSAFAGFDVRNATAVVNAAIAAALVGMDVCDQRAVDDALADLDPSGNFAALGANATTATSMACAHAAAAVTGVPLWHYLLTGPDIGGEPLGEPTPCDSAFVSSAEPAEQAKRELDEASGRTYPLKSLVTVPLPEIQIFGGGAHAGERIDIQDLMVMAPGAGSFAEALDWTAEIYRAAGGLVPAVGVADEGGWWPSFDSNEHAIETLATAVATAGFALGRDVVLSLDIAASEFWRDGAYRLVLDHRTLDTDGLIDLVTRWCTDYGIASVEDPLGEHDVAGMRAFTDAVGDRVQVVGDDIFVTNAGRIAKLEGVANAVLVKVNQTGTLSRAVDAISAARAGGLGAIVSARSGESEDVTIAHLAVGWQVGQLKVGSITRGERTAKWNEMIRIEEALGDRATFAGWQPLPSEPPRGT